MKTPFLIQNRRNAAKNAKFSNIDGASIAMDLKFTRQNLWIIVKNARFLSYTVKFIRKNGASWRENTGSIGKNL